MSRLLHWAAAMLSVALGAVLALPSELAAHPRRRPRLTHAARHRLSARLRRVGLSYPPRRIHLRVLKREHLIELWAASSRRARLRLVHAYPICGLSGGPGPKRRQGDRQVPEGFYHVDRFNPRSRNVVSLGLNYPNRSDRILGHPRRPGGDIFIHGGCGSIGCMAVGDRATREIYWAALGARARGQRRISVHIYPTRMTRGRVRRLARRRPRLSRFWRTLAVGYRYFEATHRPAPYDVDPRGRYTYPARVRRRLSRGASRAPARRSR